MKRELLRVVGAMGCEPGVGGGGPGVGGGVLVWKRVPTAVRPPRRCGCCDPRWLKKGGCPLIIFDKRGAVRVFTSTI